MARIDVYQTVTDRILEALERGTVPWRKPWKESGLPINVRNGRPYRGINVLILGLSQYADPRWGTFNAMREAAVAEAKAEGREVVIETSSKGKKYWEIKDGKKVWFKGGIRKGEKSTSIILSKRVPKKAEGDEEPGQYWLVNFYNVFNVEQTEGIAPFVAEEEREFVPIERAQEIVSNYVLPTGSGPVLDHGWGGASYSIALDAVKMPDPERFESDETYYDTLFHELIHSTGHKKRLDRLEPALFGTDPYAREELVAEIGASFLSGVAGLQMKDGIEQSAAYISSWAKRFEQDPKLIVSAAGSAQRAADLVLGTTFDQEPEATTELVTA